MKIVGNAVEDAILEEFRNIDDQGGVVGAVERRYQRSQIQASSHMLERQIYEGIRPLIGLNRYADPDESWPEVPMIRTSHEKKQRQRHNQEIDHLPEEQPVRDLRLAHDDLPPEVPLLAR